MDGHHSIDTQPPGERTYVLCHIPVRKSEPVLQYNNGNYLEDLESQEMAERVGWSPACTTP